MHTAVVAGNGGLGVGAAATHSAASARRTSGSCQLGGCRAAAVAHLGTLRRPPRSAVEATLPPQERLQKAPGTPMDCPGLDLPPCAPPSRSTTHSRCERLQAHPTRWSQSADHVLLGGGASPTAACSAREPWVAARRLQRNRGRGLGARSITMPVQFFAALTLGERERRR